MKRLLNGARRSAKLQYSFHARRSVTPEFCTPMSSSFQWAAATGRWKSSRTHLMLDIRLIRENPGQIKVELKKVGFPAEEVDRLLAADARRRKLQHDLDEMRARRTRESKELGKMAPEEREARRAEVRALGQKIGEDERE